MSTEYLHQFGFNPEEYKRLNDLPVPIREQEIQRNLESNEIEAFVNHPVSPLCQYWFNTEGHLHSDSSLIPETAMLKQFEPSERDGVTRYGFTLVEKKIRENPNKVVLWFSPPGRKSLLKENPSETPFIYGQLYVYYYDGQKVNLAAIKTDDEGMLPFISPKFTEMVMIQDEAQRIGTMLLNPIVLNEDWASFLTKPRQNVAVFKDQNGKIYYWNDIVRSLRDTFEGKRNNVIHFDKQKAILKKEILTKDDIVYIYLSAARDRMQRLGYGYHQEMKNYGPCPGNSTSMSLIDSILGNTKNTSYNNFDVLSTSFRQLTQGEETYSYTPGKCRICDKAYATDEVGPCKICKSCEKHLQHKELMV